MELSHGFIIARWEDNCYSTFTEIIDRAHVVQASAKLQLAAGFSRPWLQPGNGGLKSASKLKLALRELL